ncbi:hypothetical protein DIZ27_14590 [Streptomyces sp. NWU339]|uniref:hypothetical protein n=1 Tax=Streptomyces sp. NWU339 TaxID=2185284 RepID=UPI000D67AF7B|nr:hypothetical protein [Streptomyces sp. NWU339]PWI09761.1 hypothetical protein DIZ27_14590 [Streptomyces sp. NWU339]
MSNTYRRYARALATGSTLCAAAGIAFVAWAPASLRLDDCGYLLPVVGCLYVATVLAWGSARERAADRRAAAEREWHIHAGLGEIPGPLIPCCALHETTGVVHSAGCTRLRVDEPGRAPTDSTPLDPGPAHGGPLCLGAHGDVLCIRPGGDGHSDHVPYQPAVKEQP